VFGASSDAGFADLAEPFRPVTWCIHFVAGTWNGPTSIAFFRGLHTTTSVTCGFSRPYNQAAQVPSSNVTCKSPRSPWINSRVVLAFDDAFHHELPDGIHHCNRNAVSENDLRRVAKQLDGRT
jgi:hypothetical protein